MRNRIIVNKAMCKKCGDIIESTHVHDYKTCKCKAIAVDGGKEYCRRSFPANSKPTDYIYEMSVTEPALYTKPLVNQYVQTKNDYKLIEDLIKLMQTKTK